MCRLSSYVYQPPDFPQLAAILRAARTLSFEAMDAFASRALQEMWPAGLSKLSSKRIPHACEAVALARKCNMPEIIKRAFYELLRRSQLGQDDDGDFEDPEMAEKRVSRGDLIRLIKAREELTSRWVRYIDNPPDIPCPLASEATLSEAGQKCAQAREQNHMNWQDKVKNSDIYHDYLHDPLCGLQQLSEIDFRPLGYCDGCLNAWRDVWSKQRDKWWDQLDVWLAIPSQTVDRNVSD